MNHKANSLLLATAVIFTIALSPATAQQQDWSQFLGPKGESESVQAKPLTKWDKNNYRWETEIPGIGWSSPVHDGKHIWLTSADVKKATAEQIEEKRKGVQFAEMKTVAGSVVLRAVCVDLESGSLVHNIELAKTDSPELIHPMNSYASPTVAISDGKAVCHFGSYGTWCLDAKSGETLWKSKYAVDHSVGPGSSPVIIDDKAILVFDGIDKQFIAAVSMSDGKEAWKTARPEMQKVNGQDSGEFQKAYSTLLAVKVDGKNQLVIPGAQWIAAYDASSGKEIWRVLHGQGFSTTPMASFEDGLVIFSTGFMRPEVVAIDPTGTGDVTKSHVKWQNRGGPTMPSMVTRDGKVYFVSDQNILHCLNAKTGEMINRKRLKGNYSASPLLAGENMYFSSREGNVSVVKADEKLEVVATNEFGGQILASPMPYKDDLIFRVASKLYRIGKPAQ